MAFRVNSFRCGNSDAIGGRADMRRCHWLRWSDAFDPAADLGCAVDQQRARSFTSAARGSGRGWPAIRFATILRGWQRFQSKKNPRSKPVQFIAFASKLFVGVLNDEVYARSLVLRSPRQALFGASGSCAAVSAPPKGRRRRACAITTHRKDFRARTIQPILGDVAAT
jgi:hypothetical protein